MLAERQMVKDRVRAERRRKLIGPRKRGFGTGLRLIRRYMDGKLTDPETIAFLEGVVIGMMDSCDLETAWRISDSRKNAIEDAQALD